MRKFHSHSMSFFLFLLFGVILKITEAYSTQLRRAQISSYPPDICLRPGPYGLFASERYWEGGIAGYLKNSFGLTREPHCLPRPVGDEIGHRCGGWITLFAEGTYNQSEALTMLDGMQHICDAVEADRTSMDKITGYVMGGVGAAIVIALAVCYLCNRKSSTTLSQQAAPLLPGSNGASYGSTFTAVEEVVAPSGARETATPLPPLPDAEHNETSPPEEALRANPPSL